MKKWLWLGAMLFALCSFTTWAKNEDGPVYTLQGEISIKENGDIYMGLVTQEEFRQKKPGRFGQRITVTPAMQEAGKVPFTLGDIPPGTYALECYQDVNGNGKMDSIFIIPTEPWGVYRTARPLMRAPRFKEMAFEVQSDIDDIQMSLR